MPCGQSRRFLLACSCRTFYDSLEAGGKGELFDSVGSGCRVSDSVSIQFQASGSVFKRVVGLYVVHLRLLVLKRMGLALGLRGIAVHCWCAS
jgi:hypothetical protein